MTVHHAPDHREQVSELMRAVVQLTAKYTGRGPTKVRAINGPDAICVVLQDSLTQGERLLIEQGHLAVVSGLRSGYLEAMRPGLLQAAHVATGRHPLAVLCDHDVDADIATIVFVLAPRTALAFVEGKRPGPSALRAPTGHVLAEG